MKNHLFTLRSLSPLHCGIGQGLNDIDLPTAKSKVTGHPIVPGSSIKGVLKDEFTYNKLGVVQDENIRESMVKALFGAEGNEFASAISVGDGNLLALPVRSYFGTFAYLTSPHTLQAFKTSSTRVSAKSLPEIPQIGKDNNGANYRCMITSTSHLKSPDIQDRLLLEELDLIIEDNRNISDDWADTLADLYFPDEEGREIFKQHFAIVDDNVLNFLCETALPVDARISIDDETGTVKPGALWYEETVPCESLFYGVMSVDKSRSKDAKFDAMQLSELLTNGQAPIHCQVGGKATTGKGFVALNFSSLEA